MSKTGEKKSKVTTSRDVLRRHLQGAAYATGVLSRAVKSGGGKKKGRAKSKLVVPPKGGWKGGVPDSNGIKATETYGSEGKMRTSECFKKGKVL